MLVIVKSRSDLPFPVGYASFKRQEMQVWNKLEE